MVEFAALEVTAKAIWWQDRDTPVLMVAVLVVVRWRMARGQSVVFRLHFILYAGNGWGSQERKRGGKGWKRAEGQKARGRMGNEAR